MVVDIESEEKSSIVDSDNMKTKGIILFNVLLFLISCVYMLRSCKIYLLLCAYIHTVTAELSSKCDKKESHKVDLNMDGEPAGAPLTEQGSVTLLQLRFSNHKIYTIHLILGSGSSTTLDIKAIEELEGRGGRKVRVIESIGSEWEEVAKAPDMGQEDIDMIKTRH